MLTTVPNLQGVNWFMQRFASLWEVSNPTSSAQTSVSVLFGQPAEFGISTDLMMAMQKMKF